MEDCRQEYCEPANYLVGHRLVEPAWYVIHVRSRHEAKVELALQQNGLEIFAPRVTVCSRRQDRQLQLKVPLFPGYLFVHTDLEPSNYHKIIKLHGVVNLLGINGHPSLVSPEMVESIRGIVQSDRPYYPWAYWGQGRRVRIMEGPLAGIVGMILSRREKKRRLVVAVELFQRSVAVELEDEAVERWS